MRLLHLPVLPCALLAVLLVLGLAAGPAIAGTAEAPDILDPCGTAPETSTDHDLPENDLCAAWFAADVTGDDVVLTATVRTLAPTSTDARVVQVGWTRGACAWSVAFDDAVASPRPVPVGPEELGTTIFPNSHPLTVEVVCDRVATSCDPDPPVIDCTSRTEGRRGLVELAPDDVAVDGTDVTITLDLGDVDLSETDVADVTLEPGDTLTDLRAYVATTPTSLLRPGGGVFASVTGFDIGHRNADVGVGQAWTIPERVSQP